VTINELSRLQLAERGIVATTVYNAFAVSPEPMAGRLDDRGGVGRRAQVRRALGVDDGCRLVLQPTRAIPRKNVAGGMQVAAELGATYWLLGGAEDGFGPELASLVAAAECPVILGPPRQEVGFVVDDAYLACDVVALPSTWEGFGNPAIESALHRRPLVIGPYPVAREIAAFGFDWFTLAETGRLKAWLDSPDPSLLDANLAVADAHFSLRDLPDKIKAVLPDR
jgi:glycosyltransferase involved in cell wall biosynthesis